MDISLEQHSAQYIHDIYSDLASIIPFDPGELVKVYTDEGKLHAIGDVLRIWWSDSLWCWMQEVLIVQGHQRWTEHVPEYCLSRHVGFCGVLV